MALSLERVGRRIQRARIEAGFNRAQLAAKIGKSAGMMTHYEDGESLTLEAIGGLAEALELPSAWFLEDQELSESEFDKFEHGALMDFRQIMGRPAACPVRKMLPEQMRLLKRTSDDYWSLIQKRKKEKKLA